MSNHRGLTRRVVWVVSIALTFIALWQLYAGEAGPVTKLLAFVRPSSVRHHVYDEAGILPASDERKFEQYLEWIFQESDIDIRFVFLPDTGGKTIEERAVELVDRLRIGGKSREERGLLLLYDISQKKLRMEVGYGLEEYFTDAFVSYLTCEHTEDFFASGDVTTGLRLLVRMLHHTIREAKLGNQFDPRITGIIRAGHLSGGAGVTETMPGRGEKARFILASSSEATSCYAPQPTPEAAYQCYLDWLARAAYQPDIALFTDATRQYLKNLPISKAYFHYLLIQEYGRKYEFDIRGNVALQVFTNDPLVCPHFYTRTDVGWQMDISAEVRNTTNRVGGIYIWDYRGRNDVYTRTFTDRLINLKNYIRIKGGDNRELPTRQKV